MKSERSKAKAYAWAQYAKFIKVRDALRTTGTTEYAKCITCGEIKTIKGNDAGHFIPGRKDAYLYDERGTNFQCAQCNRFKQGAWVEYEEAMLELHGPEVVAELKALKHSPFQYSTPEHREIGKKYQKKVKELLKNGYVD